MTSGVHELSSYEKYYGKKLDLSHVRIFGSIAYMHIPDKKRQKQGPKMEKCILVDTHSSKRGTNASTPLLGRFV